jgi:hypothetical protein
MDIARSYDVHHTTTGDWLLRALSSTARSLSEASALISTPWYGGQRRPLVQSRIAEPHGNFGRVCEVFNTRKVDLNGIII